jgi:3-oxoacyl-[acyl-carrier-protein] synthase II
LPTNKQKRVVITSMGAVTAAGDGIEKLWQAVREGKSAIKKLKGKNLNNCIGAQVDDAVLNRFSEQERTISLALMAAEEALEKSHLPQNEYRNVHVFIGSSKGGLRVLTDALDALTGNGQKRLRPDFLMEFMHTAPSNAIAGKFGFGGMCMGFVSSCTTGIHSLIMGAKFIAEGRGNIVLAGATESAILPLLLAGYNSMGALSKQTDIPEQAMKPFDRHRDGFAIGEGAGLILLESLESARHRGAEIYAEITGWSFGCDTYGLTAHCPDGKAIAREISKALQKANISPTDINYINAHGTATKQNDLAEARGMQIAFGDAIKKISISSTKPVTGHLLGAAGSIETIITTLVMRDSIIPATLNLNEIDPLFAGIDFTPNISIKKKINSAIKMNFGFGGHIGILVLAKCR